MRGGTGSGSGQGKWNRMVYARIAPVNTLRFLADALITFVLFIVPLVLIIGVPARVIYRAMQRRGWIRPRARKDDSVA